MENSLVKRYIVATIGLIIVAFGVALAYLLRSKLGDYRDCIKTVRGVGYKFET